MGHCPRSGTVCSPGRFAVGWAGHCPRSGTMCLPGRFAGG